MDYNEIYSKTKSIIVDYLRIDSDELKPETDIIVDLCVDSIAMVELSFRFSEAFCIPMLEVDAELFVMKNLVDYIYEKVCERGGACIEGRN
ncbi:MAG: acyl carrier protein [Clostridiaceae bacterium]|mgnify:CR=1 FL=1|nr:acyl carrier protein [Clostridiaceae bacterium]